MFSKILLLKKKTRHIKYKKSSEYTSLLFHPTARKREPDLASIRWKSCEESTTQIGPRKLLPQKMGSSSHLRNVGLKSGAVTDEMWEWKASFFVTPTCSFCPIAFLKFASPQVQSPCFELQLQTHSKIVVSHNHHQPHRLHRSTQSGSTLHHGTTPHAAQPGDLVLSPLRSAASEEFSDGLNCW